MRKDWAHQTFAVSEYKRIRDGGSKSMCITAPTGAGKGTVIQRIIEDAVDSGKKAALITQRRLLTSQLAKNISACGTHVGVRAADFESWTDYSAPVQICSVGTELSRVIGRRKRLIEAGYSVEYAEKHHRLFPADVLIIDEAHMAKGDSTRKLIQEYQDKYSAVVVGLTATPLGIGDIYDDLIVAGNNSEMRACGALVMAKCFEPAVIDVPKVRKSKTGIFSQSELDESTRAIWSQFIVGNILTHWKKHNPDGKPSIGFAPGVKESFGLAVDFWSNGINAAHISADSIFVDGKEYKTNSNDAREDIFARSKSGEVPIIFNMLCLREGVDLPWLECLILATPIASFSSYLQTVGRILRASPSTGKTHATILDHANNLRMHGSPNLDHDDDWRKYFRQDEQAITRDREEKKRNPENKEPEPITCPKCSRIRQSGRTCPECGFQHETSVRYVIQESGRLKAVEGDLVAKRKVKMKDDTAALWESCYRRCRNAKRPMSFMQVRGLFVKDNHYYPPENLPFMPKNKGDWRRKVKEVGYDDLIPREAPVSDRVVRGPTAPRRPPAEPSAPPIEGIKTQRKTLFDEME